ncbi:MAG TPA: aminodeoxychorismate/anthranilate synthase component II [candidate division Zixibacteria bacterium]|nr:aminodeoxychorismate/anthranilate synthase component II [candidate division Zixibacteria bacterium]MDD4918723.1 aminodeoxychorismate/anthranilate synthase component II [candidate division Zixibacteria bacterium]MDM7973932.1 aminodeoxychorismate/anthranilate synthase component II [candidate division Zixibacteria bacterium]HOD65773.1 aminodeoxychorismate/anthranilate synthase component II [candidate division Zixibacteria bacterium]HOZ07415.1 aminodeoxychorismate/anthranilate synthase component
MILLLDNYDSFTYNLFQYLAELGAQVEVIRNDRMEPGAVWRRRPAAIVLSPGPGRPENAGIMNRLIAEVGGSIPVLGVCLGHQAIAQVYGARIVSAPTLMHGKTSAITHDRSALFAGIDSPFTATRYHSLMVAPAGLPRVFKVTARSADGVIMALQHRRRPLYGVQFHPESILTAAGRRLLANFLKLCLGQGENGEGRGRK